MKGFLVFMAVLNLLLAVANIILGNIAVGLFGLFASAVCFGVGLGE